MRERLRNSCHFYAWITIIFWSVAFIFTKEAMKYFDAYTTGFGRYIVASVILIVYLYVKKIPLPKKKDIPLFIVSGAIGFFLYMIVFNTAATMLPSATCSIVIAMAPILTALEASFWYQEKIKGYQWFAFAVSFLGILVLLGIGDGITINRGVLWAVASAVVLGTYNTWQRKLTKTYTGLQSAAYSILFGTLMLGIFAPRAFVQAGSASLKALFGLVIMGIFSSAVSYVCWSKAFSLAKRTSDVSNYMFITPFLTALIGFVVNREVPDLQTLIGGVLIISGVLLFRIQDFVGAKNGNTE